MSMARVWASSAPARDQRPQGLADQLKRQYVIEYALDDAKPSHRVSVGTIRKDVTVRAPTYVPDKF